MIYITDIQFFVPLNVEFEFTLFFGFLIVAS